MGLFESLETLKLQKSSRESEKLEKQKNLNSKALIAGEKLSQYLGEFVKKFNPDLRHLELLVYLHSKNCKCEFCKGREEIVTEKVKRTPEEYIMWSTSEEDRHREVKKTIKSHPRPPYINIFYMTRSSYLAPKNHIPRIDACHNGVFHSVGFDTTSCRGRGYTDKNDFLYNKNTGAFDDLGSLAEEALVILKRSPPIDSLDDSLEKSNSAVKIIIRPF